jgi:hypothetical protein
MLIQYYLMTLHQPINVLSFNCRIGILRRVSKNDAEMVLASFKERPRKIKKTQPDSLIFRATLDLTNQGRVWRKR